VTATSRSLLLSKKTDLQEIEVYVEILEDTTNPDLATGTAKTSFSPETVQLVMPEYEFVGHKITKFDGKFELKGKITIQTAYGPGAKATDLSGYGRGTTPEDEKNGDVTLGFHESCHREDFLEYLRTHPFPEFSPRVGMLVVQYQAADRKFQSEFRKYPQDINDYSAKRTDEVGYKESQYDKYGPRKP